MPIIHFWPKPAPLANDGIAMALPETSREVYSRNPLAEVSAQLRFPPILRVDAEPPARFQEAVRGVYSLYRHEIPAGQLPANVPAAVRQLFQGIGHAAGPVQHVFETQDRTSSVTLSRDSLALKTTAYTRWEQFREQLTHVRQTFEGIYLPSCYVRLGLRYVDIIRRSLLGLTGIPWSELLNPAISGELSVLEFGENVDSAQRQFHCKLDGDNNFLTLSTGIALAEPGTPGGISEKCFLINADFHTHIQTETANVTAALDAFNKFSGNLFRWAVLPRLREALGPQPLGRG